MGGKVTVPNAAPTDLGGDGARLGTVDKLAAE
jgi:hypothetical protein